MPLIQSNVKLISRKWLHR